MFKNGSIMFKAVSDHYVAYTHGQMLEQALVRRLTQSDVSDEKLVNANYHPTISVAFDHLLSNTSNLFLTPMATYTFFLDPLAFDQINDHSAWFLTPWNA